MRRIKDDGARSDSQESLSRSDSQESLSASTITPYTGPPMTLSDAESPISASTSITVTATWGKELFSPQPFHTFEVGPFSLTVVVPPGHSPRDVLDAAYKTLDAFASLERERKRAAFITSAKKP